MLDKAALDTLGREMRRRYEEEPKGGIPANIWRLLLTLEARARQDQPRPFAAR